MKYILVIIVSLIMFSCNDDNFKSKDSLNLKEKLAGNWIAKAFTGELHEKWVLEKGWMQEQSYYIENNDTSYSAISRIEKIENDIILFSVIKNSNPKIFKAISVEENEIVFENKDYKNPYQVKYEFLNKNNFKRTIIGLENDSLVIYEFNFKKVDK